MDTGSDLIRQAQQGDADAYAVLMQQYQEVVFRFACLMLGDADDAEDIAQETFIRAYDALHRFDLERPLRPWLLQIAANLCRNRRRAIGRYVAALRRAFPLMQTYADAPSIETPEALEAALQHLNERDREIIYLRFVLSLSVEETASILNIESGTVKSRLSRALKRLRGIVLRDYPILAEGRQ